MTKVSDERAIELYRKKRSESCIKGGKATSRDSMEMSRRGKRSLETMTAEERSARARHAAAVREEKRQAHKEAEREMRRRKVEELEEIEAYNERNGIPAARYRPEPQTAETPVKQEVAHPMIPIRPYNPMLEP